MYPTNGEDDGSLTGYAENQREAMHEVNATVMENRKKCARTRQINYNQHTWSSTLEPGDHISVRTEPTNLHSYWGTHCKKEVP